MALAAVMADKHAEQLISFSKRSLPVPNARLSFLSANTAVKRQDSSSTSSSSSTFTSCGPKDTTGPCERPITSSTNTVPIVLGVVIPLGIAFCVLIFLHRRHVKKLRREDAEDKTKSWDFGMDGAAIREKKGKGKNLPRRAPEMSAADAVSSIKHDRGGISMDMGLSNPYLLPPELHQSRESLHSLSRTLTGDDKYRQTDFIPDDGSIRSPSSMRSHWDNSSTYTGSSKPRIDSESTKNLIRAPTTTDEPVPTIRKPVPVPKDPKPGLLAPAAHPDARDSYVSTNSSNGNVAALRASNDYLGSFISGGHQQDRSIEHEKSAANAAELESPAIQEPKPTYSNRGSVEKRTSVVPDTAGFNFGIPDGVQELPARYSVRSSMHGGPGNQQTSLPQVSITSPENHSTDVTQHGQQRDSSVYEENFATFQNHPNAYAWPAEKQQGQARDDAYPDHQDQSSRHAQPYQGSQAPKHDSRDGYGHEHQRDPSFQQHREAASQSLHPNRPNSHQQDSNARESFVDYYDQDDSYDISEYQDALGYDPRLLTMGLRPLPPDDPTENPEERANRIRSFYKEYFDEAAKPGGGNRMSYFDGSEGYYDDYYGGTAQSSPYGSRGPSMMRPATQQQRHRAMSNGSYGPRAYSSASGRYGRPPPRPRQKLPPPKDLNVLPTPYKLKDDSLLPNPMDYAPPQVFKNQRSGTPDSLRGGVRPYSPSTKAFNPLVSSFDDLSALPSPHQLRKSSTFTSLDFAPPRFQAKDSSMSETGSIRSNRSGVSAFQQHNIRTGAYRVSRIPKEVAGTKDEIASALRPQWNMNR